MSNAELLGAIARGWCHDKNSHKVMDEDLAVAIAEEVMPLIEKGIQQGKREAWEMIIELAKLYDAMHDHGSFPDFISKLEEHLSSLDNSSK